MTHRLTRSRSPSPASLITRRHALAVTAAALGAPMLAGPARALTNEQATALVNRVVSDINAAISSGRTGSSLYRSFEQIFLRYADVPVIASLVMAADWRRATDAQRRSFAEALRPYLARKYGSRFREFEGGSVEVRRVVPRSRHIEVEGVARLRGQNVPVVFLVNERGGQQKFFDIRIENVSIVRTERDTVGAMLDRRGGDIDQMIADLRNA